MVRAEDFLAVKRTQLKRGGDQAVGEKLEMEALHVGSAVPWLAHESVGRVDCGRDAGCFTGAVHLKAYHISNVHQWAWHVWQFALGRCLGC